jgi:hypothetical protein
VRAEGGQGGKVATRGSAANDKAFSDIASKVSGIAKDL